VGNARGGYSGGRGSNIETPDVQGMERGFWARRVLYTLAINHHLRTLIGIFTPSGFRKHLLHFLDRSLRFLLQSPPAPIISHGKEKRSSLSQM